MWNITEKMKFDIPFMISLKDFEIRTVLYENDIPGNYTYLTIMQFSSRQHLGLITRVNNGIFSFPLTFKIFIDVEHYLENNI